MTCTTLLCPLSLYCMDLTTLYTSIPQIHGLLIGTSDIELYTNQVIKLHMIGAKLDNNRLTVPGRAVYSTYLLALSHILIFIYFLPRGDILHKVPLATQGMPIPFVLLVSNKMSLS